MRLLDRLQALAELKPPRLEIQRFVTQCPQRAPSIGDFSAAQAG